MSPTLPDRDRRSTGSSFTTRLPSTLLALASAALVLLLAAAPRCALAIGGDAEGSLRKAGEGLKTFGKKVGVAGAEAGREIAGLAKRVWYKGKRVSQPLLRDVQATTREYWGKVIAEKDRTIARLREENARLRSDAGEGRK